MEEMVEVVAEEQAPKLSEVIPTLGSPSSTLATSKTLGAEQATLMCALLSASVASSKHGAKQHLEPAPKVDNDEPELELGPETEKKAEITPAPEADPNMKPDEQAIAVDDLPLVQSPAELSPEQSPLPVSMPLPVPLPVLHPSIFAPARPSPFPSHYAEAAEYAEAHPAPETCPWPDAVPLPPCSTPPLPLRACAHEAPQAAQ